jgi:hypothetical protein
VTLLEAIVAYMSAHNAFVNAATLGQSQKEQKHRWSQYLIAKAKLNEVVARERAKERT